MPGVDDPARVKALLQTEAMLELTLVEGGPFPSREQALAEHGGVLPLNTQIVKQMYRSGDESETWWLLRRSSVVTGRDIRNARVGRDEFGKWETDFTHFPGSSRPIRKIYRIKHRKPASHCP